MKLNIIGNGFDCAHGIRSTYADLCDYLRDRNVPLYQADDLLDDLGIDLWSDFETALGELTPDRVVSSLEADAKEREPEDISRQHHLIVDKCSLAFDCLKELLQYFFRSWVESIDITKAVASGDLDLDPSDLYLTFNYTEVLEEIYGIPETGVCHIHGRRNTGAKLLVGHGRSTLPRYGGHEWSATDETLPLVYGHLEASYKDVRKNIKGHASFFRSLKGIDKVCVYGFSFGKVDLPYLQEIIRHIGPAAKWEVACHAPGERAGFEDVLIGELGIPRKNVKLFSW